MESAHKTLGCLTGGAWLHLKNPQDAPPRAGNAAVELQFEPFLSDLALAGQRARLGWTKTAQRRSGALIQNVRGVPARCRLDSRPANAFRRGPNAADAGRLRLGADGLEAYAQLRDRGLALEMADFRRVVAISTVFDREEDFSRLLEGLRALQRGAGTQKAFPSTPVGIREMPLREAALSPSRTVPLERATGKISARAVGAYPPGWPAILPGERFTGEVVAFLAQMRAMGATLFGLEGDAVSIVKKGDIDHAV